MTTICTRCYKKIGQTIWCKPCREYRNEHGIWTCHDCDDFVTGNGFGYQERYCQSCAADHIAARAERNTNLRATIRRIA